MSQSVASRGGEGETAPALAERAHGCSSADGASPSGSAQHCFAGGDPTGNHVFSSPWEDHKTTTIISYQQLLAHFSDAGLKFHRALGLRLICWEHQNGGESCGPAGTCSSQLLQHQQSEFLHMAPPGHGGTVVLETSPGMKAGWYPWFREEGKVPGTHSRTMPKCRWPCWGHFCLIYFFYYLRPTTKRQRAEGSPTLAGHSRDGEHWAGWD